MVGIPDSIVHIRYDCGLCKISYLNDLHNHELLEERYCSMLPAHRRMTVRDILQAESLQKVGITTRKKSFNIGTLTLVFNKIDVNKRAVT